MKTFDPDADIFEGLEKYSGRWSEHKDLLHKKASDFLKMLNEETAEQAEDAASLEEV